MPGHEVVRERGAGPVVVDHRLDLAGHERAHVAEQLAVLVLEQQLEAEEVGEGGVLEPEVLELSHAGSPRRGRRRSRGRARRPRSGCRGVRRGRRAAARGGISRACIRGLTTRDDRVVVAAHHQRRLPDQAQERQAAPAGHRGQLVVVAALGPRPRGRRAAGRRRVPGSVRMRAAVDLGGDAARRTPGRGAGAASSIIAQHPRVRRDHQRRRCRWRPAPRVVPAGGTGRRAAGPARRPRRARARRTARWPSLVIRAVDPGGQRRDRVGERRQRRLPPTPGTSNRTTPRSGSSASTSGWSASRLTPMPLHSSSGGSSTQRPTAGTHRDPCGDPAHGHVRTRSAACSRSLAQRSWT